MARLRRSELSTPGSQEKMIMRAADSDADLVFLDLEDAVAPAHKERPRATGPAAAERAREEEAGSGAGQRPEPVPAEDRLPVEVVLLAPDTLDGKAQLIDLLESALGIEIEGPGTEFVEKHR